MTPEERLEKLETHHVVMQDQMIVIARMQQEAEKRWSNQAADVWEGFAHLARAQARTHESVQGLVETGQGLVKTVNGLAEAVHGLAETVQALADRQATMQAALEALIATVDKFVKGQSGDGRHDH